MKKIIAAAVTVTTVLSLAACGGNTAVDKSDCLDVPQDVLNVVASGSDSSGLKPETGKAVKGDTEGTYWLAMKFTADGFNGDTETGIWLVSGLDAASAAPVMSVDGFAKQFTHWPTQNPRVHETKREDHRTARRRVITSTTDNVTMEGRSNLRCCNHH